jgi:hypothetical protein
MSIPEGGFHIRPVKTKPHRDKPMKTKTTFQLLTLAILAFPLLPLNAQTVVWERKAFGQTQSHPCGGTFTWPNNNFWGQQEVISTECKSAFVVAPSNWSTKTYPDGAAVNVILGAGGASGTTLNQQTVTLNSLTIQSVGALNISYGSAITANSFVFEGDGAITNVGGGGADPFITINPGGSMTKTGGTGSFTFPPNLVLQSSNATFSSLTGSLVLSTILGTQANPTFHAEAGASVVLVASDRSQALSGNVQSTGAGTIVHNSGHLLPGAGGVEFNFQGASFQWTGGNIEALDPAKPFVNKGTINVAGVESVYGPYITNSGLMVQTGAGSLNFPYGTTLTNSAVGTFDLKNDNALTAAGGGGANPTFQNNGVLRKSAGTGTSVLDVGLVLKNSGTIDIQTGTLQIWLFEQTSGTTSLNGGNLKFVSNEAQFNGGSVVGSGTITGSIRNNGATFAPGFSPGKITIDGNYAQTATGVLNLEIGGTIAGTEYDQLVVNGNAGLGGTLNVTLINGFRPKVGDVFQLIVPNTTSGTFATINTTGFTGTVNYANGGITLTVATVPDVPLNISTRMQVGADPNQLIGGFIVTGSEPKKVIVLATGPSLAAFGVTGVLADPVLELFQGNTLLASNDNWKVPAQAEVQATGLQPSHDLESALVQTLAPGAYTAVVRGTNGTGIGTVQVFDLSPDTKSKLANISSRGLVQAADSGVMIAGFFISGNGGADSRVVVRALGPSLSAFGVAGALADPTLELKNSNGATLASNDEWQQSAAATEISSRSLAPGDMHESALAISLPGGGYTAIVRGHNGGTGVGVVEVYNVD